MYDIKSITASSTQPVIQFEPRPVNLKNKPLWKKIFWLFGMVGSAFVTSQRLQPKTIVAQIPASSTETESLTCLNVPRFLFCPSDSSLPQSHKRKIEGHKIEVPTSLLPEFEKFKRERSLLNNKDGMLESALRQRRSQKFIQWMIENPLVFSTQLPTDKSDLPLITLVRYGYAKHPHLFQALLKQSRHQLSGSKLVEMIELLLFTKENYEKALTVLLQTPYCLSWDAPIRDSNLFFQSIILGKNELLQVLIQKGADLNQPDLHGMKPLDIAIISGNWNAFKLLLKNGAKSSSATYYAALLERHEMFKELSPKEKIPLAPFDRLAMEKLMRIIPISLRQILHDELSFQERHINLSNDLASYVYESCLSSSSSLFSDSIKEQKNYSLFYLVHEILKKTLEIENAPVQRYRTMIKKLQSGVSVQLPVLSRSVDLDQLKRYMDSGQIGYSHRGYPGIWLSQKRESYYGDYTIWFSKDVLKHPMCKKPDFWFSIANSIDWKDVVQISCPTNEIEQLTQLLRLKGFATPVVAHEEADLEQSLLLLSNAFCSKERDLLQIVSCPLDYRKKNTVISGAVNWISTQLQPMNILFYLALFLILIVIETIDKDANKLAKERIETQYEELLTKYDQLSAAYIQLNTQNSSQTESKT